MYIVIGTRPDGRTEHLQYETLDEAMQKVRDLVEADELDAPENGAMFVRYAIELDPPLHVEHDADEAQMMPGDERDDEGEETLVFRPKFRDDGVWDKN